MDRVVSYSTYHTSHGLILYGVSSYGGHYGPAFAA